MNIVGIVGEYNPFHRGHAWHLARTREGLGADCAIVCAMSGDFVQRGETAVFPKYARAEAACRAGVDLVLELPLPWCLASAEGFARGAVALLAGVGCTHLSFGSECGELGRLTLAAAFLVSAQFNAHVQELMEKNPSLSYASARQAAADDVLGADAELLKTPNNILALEYLKAIYSLGLGIEPFTVQRRGAGHDETDGGEFKSAAELRRRMAQGVSLAGNVPVDALRVYEREMRRGRALLDSERLETAVLSRLRFLDEQAFLNLPDAADGLGRRLYLASREEPTLEGVLTTAKSKRYALSRLRRMVCCAALGVTAADQKGEPGYARVLAVNARGREVLRLARERGGLPVIHKSASIRLLGEQNRRIFALGSGAHDLAVLCCPNPLERRGGGDWRQSPVIL